MRNQLLVVSILAVLAVAGSARKAAAVDHSVALDAAALTRFLSNLGDSVYSGAAGALTLDGENYAIVETRVMIQQKKQDGNPAATLRLLRRASKLSNPEHVVTVAEELTLIVRAGTLVVRRDGHADAAARLDANAGENALAFTYDKTFVRYGPDVAESFVLKLDAGTLSVERVEGTAVNRTARESFSASR